MLRTTTDEITSLFQDAFVKSHPLNDIPEIITNEEFPEVILIGNINDHNELQCITDRKEVIVDVNCAASILRGIEHL